MTKTFSLAASIAVISVASTTFAEGAAAQTSAPSSKPPTVVTAGPGQRALVVAPQGDAVYVRACVDPAKACDPSGGTGLRPPESVRGAVGSATVEPIELEGGKRAAVVRLTPAAGRSYAILVASPDRTSDVPAVLFSGFVGKDGASSTRLEVEQKNGKAQVKVVTRDALCGVDVLTSLKKLDPNKLVLRDEPTPDPAGAARASASALPATALDAPAPHHAILHARGSSSGRAWLAVDGDPSTAWVDSGNTARPRPFVSLSAPHDVPLVGLDFDWSLPKDQAAVVAPKRLLVMTDGGAFDVSVPADAVAAGGKTFRITLPKPIQTKCVGVIVDESYPARKADPKAGKAAAPRVYIGEVGARTTLDGETLTQLAESLGTASPEAKLREAILFAYGARGIDAIVAAYPKLDGPSRDRARRVVDATGCEDKLALYVPLLLDKDRSESDRARDWIRRCGKESGPQLVAAFEKATLDDVRGLYAEEAALVAPDLITKTLVQRLSAAQTPEERRAYRKALTKGTLRAAGVRALDASVGDASFGTMGTTAKIDVLRAFGPSIGTSKHASKVFADLAPSATEFRDKYLLLTPASELARAGDAGATTVLQEVLGKSDDARLRAHAAELGGGIAALRPLLIGAVSDDKVRVREAALLSLTSGGADIDETVRKKVVERLEVDPWTFVRRAAATALAGAPKDPAIDARIARAVDNEAQPMVRAEMLRALGARGASKERKVIFDRAFDGKEALSVRLRAVEALGAVCDREGVAELTELAQTGAAPLFEQDRKLAAAAVNALVRIQPPDLKQRLAPMLGERAAPDMREVAKRALSAPPANACK
ncbi:MAG: hypothetical protein HOW73_17190 [Polyangiaceae bacterium]|nr:hypothetical protein [Polyangiaceae bacterium]